MALRNRSAGGGGDMSELPALYSIVKGEVVSVQQYGVFVKLPGCTKNGLVHISQMSSTRVEQASEVCEVGEKVYCKVISIEPDGTKIALSMKVVNQSSGQDLDPNQVQSSQDGQRRQKGFQREIPRIELGAIYDTTCKKCGGKGHLAQDCFHRPGEKAYDLVEEVFAWPTRVQAEGAAGETANSKKKKKKDKKKKEKKKEKKKKHEASKASRKRMPSDSDSTASSDSDGGSGSKSEHRRDDVSSIHKPHDRSIDEADGNHRNGSEIKHPYRSELQNCDRSIKRERESRSNRSSEDAKVKRRSPEGKYREGYDQSQQQQRRDRNRLPSGDSSPTSPKVHRHRSTNQLSTDSDDRLSTRTAELRSMEFMAERREIATSFRNPEMPRSARKSRTRSRSPRKSTNDRSRSPRISTKDRSSSSRRSNRDCSKSPVQSSFSKKQRSRSPK